MSATETTAGRYKIDAGRSRFIVQAFAEGLLSMFGHNPKIAVRGFGGDVRFNPSALEESSVLILVQADSLAVADNVSDKDRREIESGMRNEVLEVARYPEIVFMSNSVSARQTGGDSYQVNITGDLTLHGVTRKQQVAARVRVNAGGLRAEGEFTLRQSDYNIKRVSAVGGTIKVKDELNISFDITAGQA